jgi:hypothetical protein
MSGIIWSKFFWSDWENDPALRLCSFAAQGLWMRMLCIAARHDPIGYVAVAGQPLELPGLIRLTGGTESELATLLGELDRNGVFSRDGKGRIYSRRMIRDAKKAATARRNGRNNVQKRHGISHGEHRGNLASVYPHKPRAKSQEKDTHRPNKTHLRAVADATRPSAGFEDFWGKYPKRDGANPRAPASRKFAAAIRAGADPVRLIAAAARYATDLETKGEARTKFVAQAVTWLDERRWEDDAAPQPTITENEREQMFAQLRGETG